MQPETVNSWVPLQLVSFLDLQLVLQQNQGSKRCCYTSIIKWESDIHVCPGILRGGRCKDCHLDSQSVPGGHMLRCPFIEPSPVPLYLPPSLRLPLSAKSAAAPPSKPRHAQKLSGRLADGAGPSCESRCSYRFCFACLTP